MKYAYFPGCAMDSTSKSYRLSAAFVADKIGLTLQEISDWNCCGATSAHVLSETLGVALPARSLALAEKENPELDVVSGCAACYGRLKHAAHLVKTDPGVRYRTEKTIEMPYEAKREVFNFLEIFSRPEAVRAIRENITRPLTGLRVVCYYGCLNVRPAPVTNARDRENPMEMDEIIALTGAEPVPWAFKSECCGAAHQNDAPKQTRPLVKRILSHASRVGARAVVTACPLCYMNLEMRQRAYRLERLLPVFSFTELLAVAMGGSAKELALESHYIPACGELAAVIRKNRGGVTE